MISKKSRYKNALLFVKDESRGMDFSGIVARKIGAATGVVEHEIEAGDRLDLIARNYYNDDRLWWRIVDANRGILFANKLLDDSMAGSIILIPKIKE